MRVLFSRCGKVFCPQCGKPIARQTIQQIVDEILSYPDGTRIVILAPLVRGRKGEYKKLLNDMLKNGFARSLVDGELIELEDWDSLNLDRNKNITLTWWLIDSPPVPKNNADSPIQSKLPFVMEKDWLKLGW